MKKLKVFLLAAAASCLLPAATFFAQPIDGVLVLKHYLNSYDEETSITYGEGHLGEIRFTQETAKLYPALQQAVAESCGERMTVLKDDFDFYVQDLKEHYDDGYQYTVSVESDISLRRADEEIFSYLENVYTFTGGAHGYYYYEGYSFDTQTGEKITLQQLIPDDERLAEILMEKLKAKYPDSLVGTSGYTLDNYGYDEEEYPYHWVAGAQGVTFFFNPYEMAPYAEGALTVTIGFREYPDLFTDSYGEQEGGYGYQLLMWPEEQIDLDGDGTFDTISITGNFDENGDRTSLSVSINGGEEAAADELWYYDISPVLLHADTGEYYLYADISQENDYRSIEAFWLNPEKPVWVGELGHGLAKQWVQEADTAGLLVPTDPSCFYLQDRENMLSSFSAVRSYSLDGAGRVVPLEDALVAMSDITLKTVKDVPGEVVDSESLEPTGEKNVIPAGQEAKIWRTDGKWWVDLKYGDGKILRVTYENETWPRQIAGEDESSYFETLYYAG